MIRVLLVDDERLVCAHLRTILGTARDIEVVGEAYDGAEAVEAVLRYRPDLVLIDLQLPDFDGYEVLRRLRADSRTRAIPCIALSANAMREDIERGLASGFADYWTKPIDFGVFIAALNRLFPAVVTDTADSAEHAPGE